MTCGRARRQLPVGEPACPAAAAEKHGGSMPGPRALPPDGPPADAALSAVLDATRALLWIDTPFAVAAVARDLVQTLGGRIVPAADPTDDALPVDVSFGAGQPALPAAPYPEKSQRRWSPARW